MGFAIHQPVFDEDGEYLETEGQRYQDQLVALFKETLRGHTPCRKPRHGRSTLHGEISIMSRVTQKREDGTLLTQMDYTKIT